MLPGVPYTPTMTPVSGLLGESDSPSQWDTGADTGAGAGADTGAGTGDTGAGAGADTGADTGAGAGAEAAGVGALVPESGGHPLGFLFSLDFQWLVRFGLVFVFPKLFICFLKCFEDFPSCAYVFLFMVARMTRLRPRP